MAIGGAVPKEPSQLARPQRLSVEWTNVENIANQTGPHLPAKAPDGKDWHPWTQRKWKNWRRMPHATLWSEADWEFAIDTAVVANRYYNGAGITTASELRLREAEMGTTLDARRALRIRYVEPKTDKPTLTVVNDDYCNL